MAKTYSQLTEGEIEELILDLRVRENDKYLPYKRIGKLRDVDPRADSRIDKEKEVRASINGNGRKKRKESLEQTLQKEDIRREKAEQRKQAVKKALSEGAEKGKKLAKKKVIGNYTYTFLGLGLGCIIALYANKHKLSNLTNYFRNQAPAAAGKDMQKVIPKSVEKPIAKPVKPAVKQGLVYIIDPGHGYEGTDKENVGTTILEGPAEKDYVLEIGKDLEKLLNSEGYQTKATRKEKTTNLTLQNRSDLADKTKDGVLVSLHVNGAANKKARGAIIFYNKHPDSEALAEAVSFYLEDIFGKSSTKENNLFRVLRETEQPAVLVELGFGGSNKYDAKVLLTKQKEITQALQKSLRDFYAVYTNTEEKK